MKTLFLFMVTSVSMFMIACSSSSTVAHAADDVPSAQQTQANLSPPPVENSNTIVIRDSTNNSEVVGVRNTGLNFGDGTLTGLNVQADAVRVYRPIDPHNRPESIPVNGYGAGSSQGVATVARCTHRRMSEETALSMLKESQQHYLDSAKQTSDDPDGLAKLFVLTAQDGMNRRQSSEDVRLDSCNMAADPNREPYQIVFPAASDNSAGNEGGSVSFNGQRSGQGTSIVGADGTFSGGIEGALAGQ
jgi:hypothetical protein